jgi:hypothetical protein
MLSLRTNADFTVLDFMFIPHDNRSNDVYIELRELLPLGVGAVATHPTEVYTSVTHPTAHLIGFAADAQHLPLLHFD